MRVLTFLLVSAAVLGAQQIRDPKPPPAAVAPQVGTGVIAGVVTAAESGRPLKRARVEVTSATIKAGRSVETDGDGQFRFTGLAPGEYTLSASKGGYVETIFGQRVPGSGRPGTLLSLQANGELSRLSLSLVKGGVITGTIVDETGEPAFQMSVQAQRWVMKSGDRTLQTVGSGTTDDRGVYRIPGLLPGDYVVTVAASGGAHTTYGAEGVSWTYSYSGDIARITGDLKAELKSMAAHTAGLVPAETQMAFATLYFPGTTRIADATFVRVVPGTESSGVNFQLQLVPLARVSGSVTGPNGPAVRTSVRFVDRTKAPGTSTRSIVTDATGRFMMAGVEPGQYTLVAQVSRPIAKPGDVPERLWATAEISADGRDLADVSLVLQPAPFVSGRVEAEPGPGAPPDLSRLSVTLKSVGALPTPDWDPAPMRVDSEGRFAVHGLLPGRYVVVVSSGLPSGYIVKSATFGGQDALDAPFEFSGSESLVGGVVTLTASTTEVSGGVLDAVNQPSRDATIIVYAAEERFWLPHSRRIQSARPSADGRFVIKGLPPGIYRIVAVDDVENGRWFDPAYLRTLGGFSTFTLGDGGKVAQDLRVR